ncbi:Bug family tripartite tricarboxylate transporter substrate binding protein [Hansschlegelia zhihuaiae]|uniref:Tripartite tricarboxylate transporter substrate binding protein n=1 Tax=Hansschlegelia zhihuaiae TaxID=405005 RepID=A0A4Q0MIB7_9HYPH|nr:tripartite tricarboxylate transporter substrate binding protein [Hansschlegelia zhihuaiae]RXF73377.1 tripartite tricarboxylate transporter substrate binding protein [Hansschlegelia zhihuaiae]
MTLRIDRRALLAGSAAVATLSALPALAQTTTLIVPYPPGGAVDILGRILAEKLGPRLGGQVVVENRGGAGGSIGVAALAKAEPDGTTLGVLNVTQLIVNKYLYASLPYDPDRDLAPISRVATGTILCVAKADVAKERGWKSFRDLIAWSKANPDQVRMGSSGVGTISHLGIELVKAKSGASIVHVPYKGGGPALVDLLGGVVEIMFDVIPALAPHVKDGKLVALAVGSRERIAAFPEVPSMKELADLGLGEVDVQTWYAVAGPKGLSDDRRTELADALAEAVADPQVKARLEPAGFTPVVDASPADLEKRIADENPMWKELVRISGAKIE